MGKLSVIKIIGLVLAAIFVLVVGSWLVFRSKSSSSSGSSSSGSSGGNCTVPTPPATEGYDLSNVTGSLSKDGFSITGVGCATGYTGTEPRAIACSVAGQDYTLSGCSASTAGSGGSGGSSSTNPCSLAGVVPPSNGTLGTTCANTEGSLEHGASCDMTCSDGYTPTNQPQCNNGVLSPTTATCTADDSIGSCIQPTNTEITNAYDFTNAQENLTMGSNFRVTDISCKDGYGPGGDSIVASVCDAANTAYTLTGCSAVEEGGDAGGDANTLYYIGSGGQSCGAICSDHNLNCVENPGELSGNVFSGGNPIAVTSGLIPESGDGSCNTIQGITSGAATLALAPYIQRTSADGQNPPLHTCYYANAQDANSTCGTSTGITTRRICKCGNQ